MSTSWKLTSRADPGDFDDCFTKPLRRDHVEAAIIKALPVPARLRVPRLAPAAPTRGAESALDLSGLIELIGDAKEDLQAILDNFCGSAVALHAKLGAALAVDDREKVVLTSHAMKGSAGYAGARCIFDCAEALETGAKSAAPLAALKAQFDGLTQAVDKLPAEIASSLALRFG